MVVISPQRTSSISADLLAEHLIGCPRRYGGEWHINPNGRGVFATETYAGIGAVADIGLDRWYDNARYRCTVVVNPWATLEAQIGYRSFSHARALHLSDGMFIWAPEQPSNASAFGDGVRYDGTGLGA
jgi:hypothetical protein